MENKQPVFQKQINEAEGNEGDVNGVVRILGLSWDNEVDCFVFQFDDLISLLTHCHQQRGLF